MCIDILFIQFMSRFATMLYLEDRFGLELALQMNQMTVTQIGGEFQDQWQRVLGHKGMTCIWI